MKTCFAEVIVDISRADLDRTFSYRIPEALTDRICPGAVVKVPFGARTILGCVVAVSETPTLDAARLRDILEVITDDTVVESSLVALAVWMKDHNGGTLNQALRTVMPRRRKVRDRLEKTVVLTASLRPFTTQGEAAARTASPFFAYLHNSRVYFSCILATRGYLQINS